MSAPGLASTAGERSEQGGPTGAATRALATSVSSPIWLCHQPLQAIAPCQKFV